jgi:hypothetical protein
MNTEEVTGVSWLSTLADAKAVEHIFGEEIPDLKGVCLHQITFHRDGPQVIVQLDLPAYPPDPPAKWKAQNFNTVQLEIIFVGARNIELNGFGTEIMADVDMNAHAGEVQVSISSPEMRLCLAADAAVLARISAYLNA